MARHDPALQSTELRPLADERPPPSQATNMMAIDPVSAARLADHRAMAHLVKAFPTTVSWGRATATVKRIRKLLEAVALHCSYSFSEGAQCWTLADDHDWTDEELDTFTTLSGSVANMLPEAATAIMGDIQNFLASPSRVIGTKLSRFKAKPPKTQPLASMQPEHQIASATMDPQSTPGPSDETPPPTAPMARPPFSLVISLLVTLWPAQGLQHKCTTVVKTRIPSLLKIARNCETHALGWRLNPNVQWTEPELDTLKQLNDHLALVASVSAKMAKQVKYVIPEFQRLFALPSRSILAELNNYKKYSELPVPTQTEAWHAFVACRSAASVKREAVEREGGEVNDPRPAKRPLRSNSRPDETLLLRPQRVDKPNSRPTRKRKTRTPPTVPTTAISTRRRVKSEPEET
ncbi:hypothetical protein SDRG_09786 [Saprolegnia diclina VS20]|uniref:Uncharacterized protein n=1 Tax=Saprolegnia diclina (strain VS20) TaxID=1156394 RepID=T0Q3T8_SAPDV|nr:hypothetical protein SDRG_09786 [Saprolegnia diclina VS20]EQC32459.1 hypothetical protein SDRG_09786 [Saprolegnia diclina VS20]|eukprot:XP_008613960.1 hypothetical protein SDRG_09786 [Saprolegnia diclina VS20]